MSRIGKQPILIPDGVDVTISDLSVLVKGPKGSLDINIHKDINIDLKDNVLVVSRLSDNRNHRSLHGTTRMILMNCVTGVSEGFYKELEIQGVGYQANMNGKRLILTLGFSHEIHFDPPEGIVIEANNRTEIKVSGIDKQLVGEVSAKIRSFRKPEPFKGKGIRYKGEYVRSKQGKTVGGGEG
ncbi:50S ribosomal protein L6 [Candidatus Marinimicrobia bacterium]|nr:50S ribosomal protein L6 [Candidatus Neomarinimicrobiota bacterium]RZP29857.1 MAG: 50S ribosomal protein L6 [bacterium]